MSRETIMRHQIADYLGIPGEGDTVTYALMGTGFNTLDENPSAQIDTKAYICDRAASSIIKGYQPQFPFDTDLIKSEDAVMELYKIGRDQLTGADAEREYVRVDLFDPVTGSGAADNTFRARKFVVAVEVSGCAGAGGEAIKVTGNLNNVGSFVAGSFNTSTRTFTADSAGA